MLKLTLHPLSVTVGLAIAGLVVLTTSQAAPPPAALTPASIRVEYMPHPRDGDRHDCLLIPGSRVPPQVRCGRSSQVTPLWS